MYFSLKFQPLIFLDFGVSCVVNLIIKTRGGGGRQRGQMRGKKEGREGREEGGRERTGNKYINSLVSSR